MANLLATPAWDDVYQLEKEPAMGGAGGVMNRQAQALLNRTEALKAQIEALNTRVNQVSGNNLMLNWGAPL